jgi:hypothetical protein
MAKRYVVTNDKGAGASFKTKAEADAFLTGNAGYSLVGDAPDAEAATETKAVTSVETEDKAVQPAENKARTAAPEKKQG